MTLAFNCPATARNAAKRRQLELGAASYDATLAEIRARDERDSKRATAPLVAASDAVVLDTSEMGIDDAVAAAVAVRGASCSSPNQRFLACHGAFCLTERNFRGLSHGGGDSALPKQPRRFNLDLRHQFIWGMSVKPAILVTGILL